MNILLEEWKGELGNMVKLLGSTEGLLEFGGHNLEREKLDL